MLQYAVVVFRSFELYPDFVVRRVRRQIDRIELGKDQSIYTVDLLEKYRERVSQLLLQLD